MKIQYLAVIFVVIMVPISLALSTYIQTQVDTIALQTSYKSKLYDATYDAVTAFQINTVNSGAVFQIEGHPGRSNNIINLQFRIGI